MLQCGGEVPSPRVGHTSSIISNVLIVWGGDTKTDISSRGDEPHDDGLYLLNLGMCVYFFFWLNPCKIDLLN